MACVGVLVLSLAGCGGGGSPGVAQNPVPAIASISPTSAPAGSRALTLTVAGSNFIPTSSVTWGGSSLSTTYVSGSMLTAAVSPANLANVGAVNVMVTNPAPGGGTSIAYTFMVASVSPLTVLTTRLPDAQHSKPYDYSVQASGGIPPLTWSVVQGSLPSGLSLANGGRISGTPPIVSSDTPSSFTLQVSDYAYQPNTLAQPLSILVHAGSMGRNDTCSTATPVTNGVIRASISPYGDVDVYSFQGTAGNLVTIEIVAQRLALYANSAGTDVFLDSFLEILDSSCSVLTYNDDISPTIIVDSRISNYMLPYTGTYYFRVSDLRGDGRPDFIYEVHISGVD